MVRGAGRWATVPGCCCDLWLVGQQARSRFRPKVVFPDAGLATMSCDCRLLPRGGLSRCAGLCSDPPDARLPCAPGLWGPRCPRHPRWRRPRPAGSSSRAVAHPRLMLPPVCCPPSPPRGSPDRPRGARGGASRPQAPEAVHLTSSRVPAPLPRATAAEGPGPGGEGAPHRPPAGTDGGRARVFGHCCLAALRAYLGSAGFLNENAADERHKHPAGATSPRPRGRPGGWVCGATRPRKAI